jgi:hypothetical protein
MRAAQEYDESDRNNRQSYHHDDIYHIADALNHRGATLVNGGRFAIIDLENPTK